MTNEEVKEKIRELESQLSELKSLVDEDEGYEEGFGKYERRIQLIEKVKENNGVISKEEWKRAVREVGMDPQGANGFFVGKRPTLVTLYNEQIGLTPYGVERINRWHSKLE